METISTPMRPAAEIPLIRSTGSLPSETLDKPVPVLLRYALSIAMFAALGPALATSPAPGNDARAAPAERDALWQIVEKLGMEAKRSAESLTDAWPTDAIGEAGSARSGSGRMVLVEGGGFSIAGALRVRSSEVRLAPDGTRVHLIALHVEGACVSPEDVAARYPRYKIVPPPPPGDDLIPTYYVTEHDGVGIGFGVPVSGRKCVERVILNPEPGVDPALADPPGESGFSG